MISEEIRHKAEIVKLLSEAQAADEAEDIEHGPGRLGDELPEAVPEPKDQINFTDPDSRIMKASNKDWDQCGNTQAVCNEHQIVLAADVTDQANDVRQLVPMVNQTQSNLDAAGVTAAIKAALALCPTIRPKVVRIHSRSFFSVQPWPGSPWSPGLVVLRVSTNRSVSWGAKGGRARRCGGRSRRQAPGYCRYESTGARFHRVARTGSPRKWRGGCHRR